MPRPDTSRNPSGHDGHTLSAPFCEVHPPESEWPTVNLIEGCCPACAGYVDNGPAARRELAARRLVEKYQPTGQANG